MQTRVYVPASRQQLAGLSQDGSLGPAPLPAYAVTSDLRREHPGTDEEELEYLALLDAAQDDSGAAVVAADVEPEGVAEVVAADVPVSGVRLAAPVRMRQVASIHVVSGTAPTGLPELSWYDATELAVVLDLLDRPQTDGG